MRHRGVFGLAVAGNLVVAGALGLIVASAPGAAAAARGVPAGPVRVLAAAGQKVCAITDRRLDKISGLTATKSGYVAVDATPDSEQRNRVFLLDAKCKIKDTFPFPRRARDPEDVVLSPDGTTLWIADIGDSDKSRPSVALWSMPVNGSAKPVIHRLSYPGGEAHDAKALLIQADGTPVIVTRESKAALYQPAAAMKANNTTPVPMKKAADLPALPKTTTSNPLGPVFRTVITGGAVASGGGRVVLRTYSDAFEWDVAGGDVVKALTSGKPKITPLPDEPFGEAITYSSDGSTFLTVSQTADLQPAQDPEILRYTPAADASAAQAAGTGQQGSTKDGKQPSWFNQLTLNDITFMIGGVGLVGLILVAAGVVGITRARRRPTPFEPDGAALAPVSPSLAPPAPVASAGHTEVLARFPDAARQYGQPPRDAGGAVYGGGTYRSGQPGSVYGAPPREQQPEPGGYGPGRYSGGVYGAPSPDRGYPPQNADPRPPVYGNGDGYPRGQY